LFAGLILATKPSKQVPPNSPQPAPMNVLWIGFTSGRSLDVVRPAMTTLPNGSTAIALTASVALPP
jgi:hypothetical protein